MPINMDEVFAKLSDSTLASESNLRDHMGSMDANKPQDLIKLQQLMQKWTMASQMQSNVIKALGEAMKSTIQNIR